MRSRRWAWFMLGVCAIAMILCIVGLVKLAVPLSTF